MIIKTFIIFFSVFISSALLAQQHEAIVSGGGYHESSAGSISWTLGEPVTETFITEDIIITQGFQQSDLIITSVDEHPDLEFQITAFPNPAKEYVNIKIDNESFKNLKYELYDFKGLMVKKDRFDSNFIHISMHDMNPGIFFLRIIEGNNKVLKTFKIVKQ